MTTSEWNAFATPPANCERGAPMGRTSNDIREIMQAQRDGERVYCRRVYLDAQGYDRGGAYWGLGKPLYMAYTKSGLRHYHRYDRNNKPSIEDLS
mgnify:CR=1 FL=1